MHLESCNLVLAQSRPNPSCVPGSMLGSWPLGAVLHHMVRGQTVDTGMHKLARSIARARLMSPADPRPRGRGALGLGLGRLGPRDSRTASATRGRQLHHGCQPDIRLPMVPWQGWINCCCLAKHAIVAQPALPGHLPCQPGHDGHVSGQWGGAVGCEVDRHGHKNGKRQGPINN